jgi:hypothetical protein
VPQVVLLAGVVDGQAFLAQRRRLRQQLLLAGRIEGPVSLQGTAQVGLPEKASPGEKAVKLDESGRR